MSVSFPQEVAQAIRTVTDELIPILGVNCVVYRYLSEYDDEEFVNAQDQIDELYSKTDISSTDNVYDDPFQSHVVVDWPDDMQITRNGEIRTDPDEDAPIEAKFKFDDYITQNSYIKIPFSMTDFSNAPADIDEPESEKNMIIRLEVNRLLTSGVDNQATLDAQLGVKRSDDNLHEEDTSLDSHIFDGFFDDNL